MCIFLSDNNHHDSEHFNIDPNSGWITTNDVFSQQSKSEFTLKILAQDAGNPPRKSIQVLQFYVGDQVQIPPTSYLSFTIDDGTQAGVVLGSVGGTGTSPFMEYYIIKGNTFDSFGLDSLTGNLYTALPMQFDECSKYGLLVQAINTNPLNPGSSFIGVNITMTNRIAGTPSFYLDPVFVNVRENIPEGSVIYRLDLLSSSAFVDQNVRFSIVSQEPAGEEYFVVNQVTGDVSVNANIDYEQVRQIVVVVAANSTGGTQGNPHGNPQGNPQGNPLKASTMTLVAQISNDNVVPFTFEGGSSRVIQVFRDTPEFSFIASVTVYNRDSPESRSIDYRIITGNEDGHFNIDPNTGSLKYTTLLIIILFNICSK